MVGWLKSLGGMLGVAGLEREGEAFGSGEEMLVGAGGLVVGLLEEGAPPMVDFSEMMLLVPMLSGWVVAVRRARGWIRLCSPKTMGWVPRTYAPGSRWVVGARVTGGRFDAVDEDEAAGG